MWRNLKRGKDAAVLIFILNFLVLGVISYLYIKGTSVAAESVGAMIFRTFLWFMLSLGLAWACRRKTLVEERHV